MVHYSPPLNHPPGIPNLNKLPNPNNTKKRKNTNTQSWINSQMKSYGLSACMLTIP